MKKSCAAAVQMANRGLLPEYGIVLPRGIGHIARRGVIDLGQYLGMTSRCQASITKALYQTSLCSAGNI